MTKAGDKILAGLESVLEYAKGNTEGSITYEIEVIDVKEVRKSLGMTQAEIADTFHVPAGNLRNWEQKRRQPEGPAKVLMYLIGKEPGAVKRALKVG